MNGDTAADEVIAAISAMNKIWTESWDEAAFRGYIHPNAVAIVPLAGKRLPGRDALVAGWRSFVETAKIHEWEETGHRVNLFCRGTVAVLTYYFTIRFTVAGQTVTMNGRDMFTLVKQGGRWLVAADQFRPCPAGEAGA
jgi:ketosteroid isomerase-like protein